MISINWLPDDVLLEIFDYFCADKYERKKREIEKWQPLVHVCRRWRTVVFGSPRRLNLRLFCKHETPVRFMLDVWPALPLVICDMPFYGSPYSPIWDIAHLYNTIALLKHSDRVCRIDLFGVPNPHMEEVLAAMQEPFPELTSLELWSNNKTEAVIPDSFLGGSAPRLQCLRLNCLPFPGLPKLLLSATHLAELSLEDIPHSGYILPEMMATALSALTSLRSLRLEFQSPRSCPDRESRRLPPLTRSIFPLLTYIRFKGASEYLDDLVASIDAPQLNLLYITFFNQIVFDTSQVIQFVDRAPALKSLDKACAEFGTGAAKVALLPRSPRTSDRARLEVKVLCEDLDWQVSSTEQVCTSCFPPLSALEDLYISGSNLEAARQDNIETALWLELLRPFTTVKNLYLSYTIVPHIEPALQELVEGRTTEVLPALQNIFFYGPQQSEPVQEAIRRFVATAAARQATGRPIAVSHSDEWP